jgi:twinkle protein
MIDSLGGNTMSDETKKQLTEDELAALGIFTGKHLKRGLWDGYNGKRETGTNPMLGDLGNYYRPYRGSMTIVTGIPMSGKSSVIDALMVNLAHAHNWKFAIFSPENYPIDSHETKVAEIFTGKPAHNTKDLAGRPINRMSVKDLSNAYNFLAEHFSWIYPSEEAWTVELILKKAELMLDNGIHLDGLVIDPWNEMEADTSNGRSKTDYVALALGKIRRFARKHKIHIWVIAHPTKLQKNKETGLYDVPTPYDISDSAHWRNKADFCMTVHRATPDVRYTEVYIQKVRERYTGRCGVCELEMEMATGRFKAPAPTAYELPPAYEAPTPTQQQLV